MRDFDEVEGLQVVERGPPCFRRTREPVEDSRRTPGRVDDELVG